MTFAEDIRLNFRVNKKNRLAGRFLPSRVYARWKWTVRCCLCLVPSILFLAGIVVVYLTPDRYQSTTVFEYLGKRPLPEVAALLGSRNVVGQAVSATELTRRLEVDMETAIDIVSEAMVISVESATGMIELVVTNTRKEIARDLADTLPVALEKYEASLVARTLDSRIMALEQLVRDAGDEERRKHQFLVKTLLITGNPPVDALAGLTADAARREWESAHNQRLAAEQRHKDAVFERENPGKWMAVHTPARISEIHAAKNAEESLGWVMVRAVCAGLVFALTIPYLLELAFPRRIRPRLPAVGEWAGEPDKPRLERASAVG